MSALVHRRSRRFRRADGFTLMELLIVIVIAGVTLGAVSLNAFGSAHKDLQNDAQRIALLLQLTRDEAILRNRPTAFEADASGYRFLVSADSGWQLLDQDDMLRQREFKRLPTRLSINPAQANTGSDAFLRITFGREPIDKPFTLILEADDDRVVIRADGIGRFSVD